MAYSPALNACISQSEELRYFQSPGEKSGDVCDHKDAGERLSGAQQSRKTERKEERFALKFHDSTSLISRIMQSIMLMSQHLYQVHLLSFIT